MSVAEWYLEVEGVKSGPYTPEQIAGLFQDGEVLAHHRATSERLGGDSISVQELVTAYQKAISEGFQPPPRPSEIDNTSTVVPPPLTGQQDATQNLFDALKAAKERQTTPQKTPPGDPFQAGARRRGNRIQPQVILIIGLGIGFCLSVYALTRLLKKQSPQEATTPRTTSSPVARNTPEAPPIQNVPLNPPQQSVRSTPRTLPRNVVPAPATLPRGGGAIRRGDSEGPSDHQDRPQETRDDLERERERERDRERDPRDTPTLQELRDREDPNAATDEEARRLGGPRARHELPGDPNRGAAPQEGDDPINPLPGPGGPEGNNPEGVAPGGTTQ